MLVSGMNGGRKIKIKKEMGDENENVRDILSYNDKIDNNNDDDNNRNDDTSDN